MSQLTHTEIVAKLYTPVSMLAGRDPDGLVTTIRVSLVVNPTQAHFEDDRRGRSRHFLHEVNIGVVGHPFNAGHPALSITCREGLTTLPWHGQRVDL